MRRSSLLLAAALLAPACDRRSPPAEQGGPAAAPSPPVPSPVATPVAASPDEVAPASGAPAVPTGGTIDRSHAGTPAPAFAFADPAGRQVTLAAYRGTPVLLNLWATWCGPCVRELPTLDALAARDAGRLRVVTLSEDMDAARARAFLAGRALPHLGAYTDPAVRWLPAVTATLPTSILYGADGRERWRVTGDLDWTGPAATKALAEAG